MTSRPGPKAPVTADPLDLSALPRAGVRRVDAFAREYLRVPKGKGALGPFRLRPWQRSIVAGLYPARGARPRQGLLAMPRGNGKTQLAAVLGVYGLFADGVEGGQVLIVASDERQAGHVFKAVRRMIELEPRLAEQVQVFTDRVYVPATDSELRTLPAEPGALQGWDPHLMIVDELHVVTDAVWEAVTTAAGKRAQSLTLAISTPAEFPESVMHRLVEHGRLQVDPSFLFVEYAAPAGCAVDDRAAWKVANPALGDFLYVDSLTALLPPKIREAAFRRYRLGQWVGGADAWMPWGTWAACTDADRVVLDDEQVILGFDGSASGDSTALVGCTVGPNPHVFVVGAWEHPPDDPRWRVPRGDVDRAVDAAFDRYDVAELAADPWGWRSEIEAWAARHGEKRVLEYNTGFLKRMGPATDRFYAAAVDQVLTHDGDPRLAAHIAHAVAKATPVGDVIVKDKRGSPRKIDLAVAGIVALDRAAWHTHKTTRKRTRSFAS